MTYSQNWFSRHIDNWNKYVVPNVKESPVCLEIGAFEGMSTVWICENLKPIHLEVVDTFKGSEEHAGMRIDNSKTYDIFLENTKKFETILYTYKISSFNFLISRHNEYLESGYNGTRCDFIHVDGSHMARDVFYDACLSWKLLNRDGIIVFDDYEWVKYVHKEEPWMTPKPALDGFLNSFVGEYEILLKSYQLILKKL